MSDDRRSPACGRLVRLTGCVAVCCGIPFLFGAGIAVGVLGLVVGSGLVVVAGVVLGVWGWHHRRAAKGDS